MLFVYTIEIQYRSQRWKLYTTKVFCVLQSYIYEAKFLNPGNGIYFYNKLREFFDESESRNLFSLSIS